MSTGLQGQKIMYTTLFVGKVCRKNPGFDKDKTDVMFGLTVWLCIFHFPLCTSQGIKVPFENKVMGLAHRSLVFPCLCFFPFLSFSLSLFFFQDDSLEHRSFIGFLCKPRKIKPLSLPFYFPYHRRRHPEGFPGSCQGWTPAQGEYSHSLQKFSVYKTRQIEILFSWFFILMTNDRDKGKHDSFWEAKNQ